MHPQTEDRTASSVGGNLTDRVRAELTTWARRWPAVLVAVFAFLAFLPGQASLPLTDRDEARFVQATRQMLDTGNLIDPRFQDSPRYKKPIGIYWLQAAAVTLSGDHRQALWAYRLPSLAAAVAAMVVVWRIGSILGGPAVGLLAAIAMTGTIGIGLEARIAKTDAALLLAILLAQLALASAWMDAARTPKRGRIALFWLAIGAGVLIKGPPILLVAGGTLLVLSFAERSTALLRSLRPAIGLPVALAVIAPWLAAIHVISNGAFFQESIGQDLLGKVAGAQESHGAPPGLHLLAQIGLFWPAAALVPLALVHAWRNRASPAVVFLAAWVGPAWLVMELVPTKLPNYVLPMMPAFAIAIALAATSGSDAWTRGRLRHLVWYVPVGAGLLALATVAGPLALGTLPDPAAVALGLAAVGVAIVAARSGAEPARVVTASAVAGTLAVAAVAGRALPAIPSIWLTDRIAEVVATVPACTERPVAIVGYREPSAAFRLGTDTRLLKASDLGEPGSIAGACAVLVDARDAAAARPALAAAGFRTTDVRIEGRNLNGFRLRTLVLHEEVPPGGRP